MDAVEYLKQLKRVCNSFKECKECRQSIYAGSICVLSELQDEKMAVEIVEKWAKEHPVKTRQSELLKLFPNAKMMDGVSNVYPCLIDHLYDERHTGGCNGDCDQCRREYWLEEIE